jgi:Do/DeqQ family serine protease
MPGEALGGLRDLQSSFHAISEAVSPSVVRIDVSEQIAQGDSRERQPFFDFFFGNPDDNEPRAPGFERGSVGSGVIVSSDRRRFYILTNDHVVGAADRIAVILEDGTELEAELVGRDPRKDLAMVVVRTNLDLPVARLGDSDTLRVGDWVVAIGSPFGYQNTVTVGIVSALGRRGGPADNISDFIQTDASINQGNSGGALLNLDGEVVGINTWITSDTGGSIGLGFAIPINNARRSIEEFLRDGEVEYGWLGVSIQSVDIAQVEELGLPSRFGALVDGVFADSPASRNGLVAGDFIYRIDGKSIRNSDDLVLVVGELAVGTKTTLEIVRNRESLSLTLSLDERKSNATISQSYRQLWPGFSVYPLSREMMEEASIDVRSGVVVAVVDPGTAAHISGLRTFDVITRINDNSVTDLASFYTIVANSDQREWQLSGIRDGEKFQVTVVR